MRDLQLERTAAISAARSITDGAKAADRDLTSTEETTVRGHLEAVTDVDKQIKRRAMVESVIGLGSSETNYDGRGVFTDEAKPGILHAVKPARPTAPRSIPRPSSSPGPGCRRPGSSLRAVSTPTASSR